MRRCRGVILSTDKPAQLIITILQQRGGLIAHALAINPQQRVCPRRILLGATQHGAVDGHFQRGGVCRDAVCQRAEPRRVGYAAECPVILVIIADIYRAPAPAVGVFAFGGYPHFQPVRGQIRRRLEYYRSGSVAGRDVEIDIRPVHLMHIIFRRIVVILEPADGRDSQQAVGAFLHVGDDHHGVFNAGCLIGDPDKVARFQPAERPAQLELVLVLADHVAPGSRFRHHHSTLFGIDVICVDGGRLFHATFSNVVSVFVCYRFLFIIVCPVHELDGVAVILVAGVFPAPRYATAVLRNEIIHCQVIPNRLVRGPCSHRTVSQRDNLVRIVTPKDVCTAQLRYLVDDFLRFLCPGRIGRRGNQQVSFRTILPEISFSIDGGVALADFPQHIFDVVHGIYVDTVAGREQLSLDLKIVAGHPGRIAQVDNASHIRQPLIRQRLLRMLAHNV